MDFRITTPLQIVRNEEQVSRNNATPGNAGYLPTLDFTAGYKGTVDNTNTKVRATGESVKKTVSSTKP